MGTLRGGRRVRAIQEKIFIKTQTKQKSGSALKKTSRVSVGPADTITLNTILVGVGLNRNQFITQFEINAVAAIYDPAASDALMNSREIKKKFKDVEQW